MPIILLFETKIIISTQVMYIAILVRTGEEATIFFCQGQPKSQLSWVRLIATT
jgi:hypothetical protein